MRAAHLEVRFAVQASQHVLARAAVLHQVGQQAVVLRLADKARAVDDVAGGDVGHRPVGTLHRGDDGLAVRTFHDLLDLADVLAVEALGQPAVELLAPILAPGGVGTAADVVDEVLLVLALELQHLEAVLPAP